MMETADLSERQLSRAHKLMQSATKIEKYILERLDEWFAFRESLLPSIEMRVLNMHEDLDGTNTDWRKILLIINEPEIGNYPVLCIYPPKPGTNLKHVISIEMMEKDHIYNPDGLFSFGIFRSEMSKLGIKFLCKEKMTYTDEDGYVFKIDFKAKAKMSYDKLVAFLEDMNSTSVDREEAPEE